MILSVQPWAPDGDLGKAYNDVLEYFNFDDILVLLDWDAMFTTQHWYKQIEKAFEEYPDAGIVTGVTNRIGNRLQLPDEEPPASHDMREHRKFGQLIYEKYDGKISDLTHPEIRQDYLGGVLMAIQVGRWAYLNGFPEKMGKFGVDNEMHRRIQEFNLRVISLRGLYVYHWYRGDDES